MQDTHSTVRRSLLVGAALAASIPWQEALAQAGKSGDWLGMVKAQHQLIAKSLDSLVASDKRTYTSRDALIRTIAYQLTAHSVAEENVLYPALAMQGMVTESDKLYLDQAHAKVMQAQLEMQSALDRPGTEWRNKAMALQAAVLKHANEDEEGNFYPKLYARMDATQNGRLTAAFTREFTSVKPAPATV